MLGVILIITGAFLIVIGALSATKWVDADSSQALFSLAFFSLVIGPLLGGGLLVLVGLMEFW
jgi:hypothetical protein